MVRVVFLYLGHGHFLFFGKKFFVSLIARDEMFFNGRFSELETRVTHSVSFYFLLQSVAASLMTFTMIDLYTSCCAGHNVSQGESEGNELRSILTFF